MVVGESRVVVCGCTAVKALIEESFHGFPDAFVRAKPKRQTAKSTAIVSDEVIIAVAIP
jgi:hypothetical protein